MLVKTMIKNEGLDAVAHTGVLANRRVEVDAIKALAIIGVLFLHMSFKSRMSLGTLETVGTLQLLFNWAVIAFFFASGLLTRPVQRVEGLIGFAATRFRRLIVPCLVFSWTYKALLLFLAYIGLHVGPDRFDLVDFLLMPVGPQFYFLPVLYGISVAVALAEIRMHPINLVLLAGGILLAIYGLIPVPANAYGADYSLLPLYLFSYTAGRALSVSDKHLRAIGLTSVLLFAIVASLLHKAPVLLYAIVPPSLLMIFERYRKMARQIEFLRLGKHSSAIYVWHAPILMPAVSIICLKLFHGSIIALVPLVVMTIVLCIGLGKATERFEILRFWRF